MKSHELVYNSRDSPETYTNVAEWLQNLVREHVHQGEGGEPLLDISSITKDEYTEALKKFADDNENRTLDDTASDMSNIGIGNLSSTSNENRENEAHLNSSNSTIIEAETHKGLNTEDPRHTDQTSMNQGTVHNQRGASGLMPTRRSAGSEQNPYGPLPLDPLLQPLLTSSRQVSYDNRRPIAHSEVNDDGGTDSNPAYQSSAQFSG